MKSIIKGFKLIVVNLLWVLCSLPLFTIGASTCAACYVCLKLLNDEEGNLFTWFFKSFKENFKQGTIMWLFIAPALYAATLCWGLLIGDDAGFIGKVGCFCYIVAFAVTTIFIFPLMSHYHNTIKIFVRNSFILGLQFLTKTLMASLLAVAILFFWSFDKYTMLVGLFFLPSMLCFIMTFYARGIFEQLDRTKTEPASSEEE